MKFKIDITNQAVADLREIEYIAFELRSPENAAHQIDRLEESIMGLDDMPFRFREYEFEPWKSRGLHIMPVDNFVVLYIPNKEKAIVTIIRIMYDGRDVDDQLKEHTEFLSNNEEYLDMVDKSITQLQQGKGQKHDLIDVDED